MHIKPRSLALALGLAISSLTTLAQDIELVTESPTTILLTFGTSVTTTNGNAGATRTDTTKSYNSVLPNTDIIRSLLNEVHPEPPESITGWELVAVRPVAGDLYELDGAFYLFLINRSLNQRFWVTPDKFALFARQAVANVAINHSTRNIISANGSIIENSELDFRPGFVRREVPATVTGAGSEEIDGKQHNYNISTKVETAFTIDTFFASGLSTLSFRTRTSEPIFSFPIDTIRYAGRGGFTGTLVDTTIRTKKYTTRGLSDVELDRETSDPFEASGLVNVQINVLPSKLVPMSLYFND